MKDPCINSSFESIYPNTQGALAFPNEKNPGLNDSVYFKVGEERIENPSASSNYVGKKMPFIRDMYTILGQD